MSNILVRVALTLNHFVKMATDPKLTSLLPRWKFNNQYISSLIYHRIQINKKLTKYKYGSFCIKGRDSHRQSNFVHKLYNFHTFFS